ncbi:MAG TPA: hypothetical protein VLX11_15930 [Candidatus Acidoferrales bacterium]|nr:hypothetical protein [Candidatus Acidoferrales bacterium]
MNSRIIPTIIVASVLSSFGPASADYVIVLNNGRRITVPSYREENGIIKFQGFGGEIGIIKTQVQSIEKLDGGKPESTLDLTKPQPAPSPSGETAGQKKTSPPLLEKKAPAVPPDKLLAEQRAQEEREYTKRLEEITRRIKDERTRYAEETTGVTGPEPGFFTTDEAFRRHQDDLMSRLIDAQNNPAGPGNQGKGAYTSQVNRMPPPYTERQKQLSELRYRIDQLELERKRLIEEMQQKNFPVASTFLDP